MKKITIEYESDGSRDLAGPLLLAVMEVLELNHAECTAFRHTDIESALSVPAFMGKGARHV